MLCAVSVVLHDRCKMLNLMSWNNPVAKLSCLLGLAFFLVTVIIFIYYYSLITCSQYG